MTEGKGTITCSKCGAENNADNMFCQECGNKLKVNSVSYKQMNKKPFVLPSIVEMIIFSALGFIITAISVCWMLESLKDHARGFDELLGIQAGGEALLQQIYRAVEFSGEGTGFVIGIVLTFIIWGVFKFNRLEKRIIELQELIKK